uniref:Exonuclease domain-containing protein n=1 Tax=Magallana gigas TaxID=29159 RepID=A0A8W8NT61_MAGGI
MDHLSTDIQRIPAPVKQPKYNPVEIEQLQECHLAIFDVETTGLGLDSHIIQLSIIDFNEECFNCYIRPEKKISPAASTVTVLLSALENNNMLESFMSTGVIGVIDTLPLFKGQEEVTLITIQIVV